MNGDQRAFLDIGAHTGETLRVVQDTRWGFDHIHCFEPASACVATLERLRSDDDRVTIHAVALWDRPAEITLHGAGEVGASLFDDKPLGPATVKTDETGPAVDTATYLDAVLPAGVDLTVKINVEGAELEVLRGLLALVSDPSTDRRITALLVHVDADKIPGHEQRAAEVRTVLDELGGATVENSAFFGPTVEAKTTRWLRWVSGGRPRRAWIDSIERALFSLRLGLWQRRQPGARRG